jgi:hypothetical protein
MNMRLLYQMQFSQTEGSPFAGMLTKDGKLATVALSRIL